MNPIIYNNIPFKLDKNFLIDILKIVDEDDVDIVHNMIDEAQKIGKPKVMYCEMFCKHLEDGRIEIGGTVFDNSLLSVNFEHSFRVFPYAITCGIELEEWSKQYADQFLQYWADNIKEYTLKLASKYIENELCQKHGLNKISSVNPGSIEDWPINEQPILFDLIGNVYDSIGLSLTESNLMVPIKSVSGIWFESETDFVSCELCDRAVCPKRRAPFVQGLYEERYK